MVLSYRKGLPKASKNPPKGLVFARFAQFASRFHFSGIVCYNVFIVAIHAPKAAWRPAVQGCPR